MSVAGNTFSALPAPDALADAYRRAVDDHSILSICDEHGVITYANDLFCQVLGYARAELIGRPFREINVPKAESTRSDDIAKVVNAGRSWVGQVCNRSKSGELLWFELIVVPLFNATGHVTAHLNIRKDITRRRLAEDKLARSEQFLREIAELAQVGGWSLDLRTGQLQWSAETKRIHEVPEDYQPSLDAAIEFYAPEARSAVTHAVETAMNEGSRWDIELPMITAKGRTIWVRAIGDVVQEEGEAVRLMGAFQDVTERKLAEDILRNEVSHRHSAEQLLRDVLETLPDGVAAYDDDDRLIVCNSAYLETYAASADAIVPGASFESILRYGLARGQYAEAGFDPVSQQAWLDERLAHHRNPPEQLTQRLSDGRWLQVREHRSPAGTTVGVRTDVTTLKRAESELRKFAEIDPLTGLLNRRRFSSRLNELLEAYDAGQHTGGVVALFDLDHFKPINDAYGHDVGDEVLSEVAHRLRSCLGVEDFAARLGGDEFIFVLAGQAARDTYDETFSRVFLALQEPLMTSVGKIAVTLSLGVAEITDKGLSGHALMKFADLAQYAAKQAGRGRWHWFSSADAARHRRDGALAKVLAKQVMASPEKARELLSSTLIPIAGAQDGRALGYSAEVSWSHGPEQLCSEALFALAQRSGQVANLGTHLIETAMEAVGDAQRKGANTGQLWLTVSADHLKLQSFVDSAERLRDQVGLTPADVTFAVPEKALTDRSSSAIERGLEALRDLGYRVAIDGFGAGATSALTMQRVGIHAVRLDRSLTDALCDEDAPDHVARALVGMAQALEIDVLACGADTPRHAARLASLGIGALQGAVVGDPIGMHDLPDHLADTARQALASVLSRDVSVLQPVGKQSAA